MRKIQFPEIFGSPLPPSTYSEGTVPQTAIYWAIREFTMNVNIYITDINI